MPNNILITPGSASIQFSGSAANTIRLQVEESGSISFYGNSGSLFGITDVLSGSLMSVNDVSGLPILEVFSDDRIVMGTFSRNTLVVTGSVVNLNGTLSMSGSSRFTGSLLLSGSPGPELTVIGDSIFTGSVVMSGSAQPELIVIGDAIITGSLTVTEQITLPVTSSSSPSTGSMFYSASFFYVYDGTQYRSASLV